MRATSTALCCALLASCLLVASWVRPVATLSSQAGPQRSTSARLLRQISMDPHALKNCGNKECRVPPNTVGTQCVAGTCSYSSTECKPGYSTCGNGTRTTTGCPIDLMTDTQNCGTCGNRCVQNNGIGVCINGQCQDYSTCLPNFSACGVNEFDGCPINLMTDPNNCGACGNSCIRPHASAPCVNGKCGAYKCEFGWGDCNNDMSDGCGTLLINNTNDCGKCGRYCYLGTCWGTGCCHQAGGCGPLFNAEERRQLELEQQKQQQG